MDVAELRERAKQALAELGPEPGDPRERATWHAERWGAAVLLAALADYDQERLRLAATNERLEPGERQLLLDAAERCDVQ